MRGSARMLKWRLVIGLAAVVLPALGGPAAGAEKRFDGVVLRIGTWGGTNRDALQDAVGKNFEALGGKIEWVIGSPQDNFAKIAAARGRGEPPMDAFEIIGSLVPEVTGRDMLAKLNYANIPNAKVLDPSQVRDTLVATWTTQEMIVYNKMKFAELGLQPPRSLKDFAEPRLAGRVMIPDISSGGGLEAVGAFAITAGGDEANIDPGLALIHSIPSVRFWKAGGDMVTGFKSGDIWLAMAHAGWAVRTNYAGVDVGTVPPILGTHAGLVKEGWIGVVRGTKRQEAAEFYIDTFLGVDAQYQMAVKTGTFPVNPAAWPLLAETPVIKDLMVLDPKAIANMTKLDFTKINLSQWNDRWNRAMAQ
jgi:putative spermidine/putrescine transport system substrate-binding protein